MAAGNYEIRVHAMRSEPAPGGEANAWFDVTFLTAVSRPLRVEAGATVRLELKSP